MRFQIVFVTSTYTNFDKYAYTWIRKLIKKLKTLDVSTTLFNDVAFVFFHVMETFSKDFLEVRGFGSRGFQLFLHELQQRCGRNFEKKCKYKPAIIISRRRLALLLLYELELGLLGKISAQLSADVGVIFCFAFAIIRKSLT